MQGVGAIYRAYADGTLEDDDEVAVAHADREHGFRALSDAMVDVRAKLQEARDEGVIGADTAASLVEHVKATFYAQRSLIAALDDGPEHRALRAWLARSPRSRKREDAVELLRTMKADAEAGAPVSQPAWTLQRTRYWEEARQAVIVDDLAAGSGELELVDEPARAVLDELRLDPDEFVRLRDRGLLVAVARHAAAALGVPESAWLRQEALDEERRRSGLLTPASVHDWLATRRLDEGELAPLAARLAVLRWARLAYRNDVAGELIDVARGDSHYPELVERAARKAAALDVVATDGSVPSDAELVSWYFRERLGRDVPVALDDWASEHGWERSSDLVRAGARRVARSSRRRRRLAKAAGGDAYSRWHEGRRPSQSVVRRGACRARSRWSSSGQSPAR